MKTLEDILERFGPLTQAIDQPHLWSPRAFVHHRLPWEADHPALSRWLRGLRLEQTLALEADSLAFDGLDPTYERWAREFRALTRMPSLACAPVMDHHHLRFRVPGRKWRQVKAFIGALQHQQAFEALGADHMVDWCAGHGHLGRTLSKVIERPVRLVERQGALAQRAQALAQRVGTPARFVQADALTQEAWEHLNGASAAVGLHACGALTNALLTQGTARGVGLLAVVPCCHHFLGHQTQYRALSQHGRDAGVGWNHNALRLSIADEIIATEVERARRRQELAWRQGLDLILRETSGQDQYTQIGPLPTRLLRGTFEAFCRGAAEHKNLQLPARWQHDHYEAHGHERARQARALGLVRALFRRPMDLWQVLDRALFLIESGRSASVGKFCPADQTPRNLLIVSRE